MAAGTYNFTLTQGDSVAIPVQILDNLGDPIDLSTTTVIADIKEQVRNLDALLSFVVTMTDPVQGMLTLSLTPTMTADLPVTKLNESNILFYDVQFVYQADIVKTEFGGKITVLQQITV
jgi:hypothetical protein